MISWGTLDPIASYALTRKEAYTRPVAADVAQEYWGAIDEISDADLEPTRVAEWMHRREESRATPAKDQHLPQSEIPIKLVEDFSKYKGLKLRILPAMCDSHIKWFDPAGFLLAKSDIPDNWKGLKAIEADFILDPSSSIVSWQPYV